MTKTYTAEQPPSAAPAPTPISNENATPNENAAPTHNPYNSAVGEVTTNPDQKDMSDILR